MRRAGKLDIIKLGRDYRLDTDGVARGVNVRFNDQHIAFDAFIDATGQTAMSARNIPFPSLIEQGVIKAATTPDGAWIVGENETFTRTGGIDLDDAFRPLFTDNLCNRLYCAAISFLLHKLPFVQGITSSRDIGNIVSQAILGGPETDKPKAVFLLESV